MSALFGILMAAAGLGPDTVSGRWRTETRGGIVEIARCGASLCGRLLTSDGIAANPALKDSNNKDAALRGRMLKGLPILGGFSFDGGAWTGGAIYNAEDGKTYSASISLTSPDVLKVQGCVLGILCGGENWTRVSMPATGTTGTVPPPKGAPKTGAAPVPAPPSDEAICSSLAAPAGLPH